MSTHPPNRKRYGWKGSGGHPYPSLPNLHLFTDCGYLSVRCPPQEYVFDPLAPNGWQCFEKVWNLSEVGPVWTKRPQWAGLWGLYPVLVPACTLSFLESHSMRKKSYPTWPHQSLSPSLLLTSYYGPKSLEIVTRNQPLFSKVASVRCFMIVSRNLANLLTKKLYLQPS